MFVCVKDNVPQYVVALYVYKVEFTAVLSCMSLYVLLHSAFVMDSLGCGELSSSSNTTVNHIQDFLRLATDSSTLTLKAIPYEVSRTGKWKVISDDH